MDNPLKVYADFNYDGYGTLTHMLGGLLDTARDVRPGKPWRTLRIPVDSGLLDALARWWHVLPEAGPEAGVEAAHGIASKMNEPHAGYTGLAGSVVPHVDAVVRLDPHEGMCLYASGARKYASDRLLLGADATDTTAVRDFARSVLDWNMDRETHVGNMEWEHARLQWAEPTSR